MQVDAGVAEPDTGAVCGGAGRLAIAAPVVPIAAGDSLQIPSNAPHSVEALEDSVAVDLFSPVREDWIRGDDAYLRR